MVTFLHTMIRVVDLARSIHFYEHALGLKESHRLDFDDFTLVYLREPNSGFEIELTLNKGTTHYERGNAYGHMAFSVADLDSCHQRLTALGYAPKPIGGLSHPSGSAARFFFMSDPDGYEIEILESTGHYA